MNLSIPANYAHVSEGYVDHGGRQEPTFRRPASWRIKFLAITLTAVILASAVLLSPGAGEAAKAGGEGTLICPAGTLTRVAAAHVKSTTHCDTLGAHKTHGPLVAGKHHAFRTRGTG